MKIHPTAIVDSEAELSEDVEIGPHAMIGKGLGWARDAWFKPTQFWKARPSSARKTLSATALSSVRRPKISPSANGDQ